MDPYKEELVSSLFFAIDNGLANVVQDLLQYLDPSTREPCLGRTALHLAVKKNNYNITLILLENGADVDAVSKDNLTALHIAVGNQSSKIVQLLLQFKANVNHRAKFCGKTALYMAVEYNNLDIADMLLSAGASIRHACTPNTTVFDVAERIGSSGMTQLLFKYDRIRVRLAMID